MLQLLPKSRQMTFIHIYQCLLWRNFQHIQKSIGLPGWHSDKESAWQCRRHKRRGFDPWMGKIPWSRKWTATPVFLPGKLHGQSSLTGYSPWGCKESDMTGHTCMQKKSVKIVQWTFTYSSPDSLVSGHTGFVSW